MSDFIPEDVVVDILSRLPTKSLIRFRSVSKLWNSLITSPNFINSHLNQSLTPKNNYDNLPLVIVRQCIAGPLPEEIRLEHYKLFIDAGEEDTNTFDEYLEIPFPLKSCRPRYYLLLGYVKGLFCVFEQDKFFFWNPSIRKSISLPKPAITKKTHGSFVDYLGFGFDSRSSDYKVVRVVSLCGTEPFDEPSEVVEVPLVEVYSLDVGAWKVSTGAGDSFPLGFRLVYTGCPSACLEGAIHFVAEHRGNWSARLICSFDLGDEVFKTMSLPNGLSNGGIRTTVFRGLLSLLCHDDFDRADKFCTVWIMKEYGAVDSWYKYVKVDLTGGLTSVIGIRNNGHILLEGGKPTHWAWELSSYDPWNKAIKKLGINGAIGHFHVDTYEENLILLNKTDAPVSRRGGRRKRKDSLSSTVMSSSSNMGSIQNKYLRYQNKTCDCDMRAAVRISESDSNRGRLYYECPKEVHDEGRCSYWQWCNPIGWQWCNPIEWHQPDAAESDERVNELNLVENDARVQVVEATVENLKYVVNVCMFLTALALVIALLKRL